MNVLKLAKFIIDSEKSNPNLILGSEQMRVLARALVVSEKTLEFYANPDNWAYQKDFFQTNDVIEGDLSEVFESDPESRYGGNFARKTLRMLRKEPPKCTR